jgi:hypothetical protein
MDKLGREAFLLPSRPPKPAIDPGLRLVVIQLSSGQHGLSLGHYLSAKFDLSFGHQSSGRRVLSG